MNTIAAQVEDLNDQSTNLRRLIENLNDHVEQLTLQQKRLVKSLDETHILLRGQLANDANFISRLTLNMNELNAKLATLMAKPKPFVDY